MFIQQLYTNCLAEAAYYIESNGEAAIVDPIRETEPYLQLAKERGTKIKYIFETHFHADFVSGHIDLAKQTGATIVFGPHADTNYKVHNAKDGEELKVGNLTIRVLHTPGHTLESSCYLLLDENYQEYCIFTGDTLFVGDVGRPDLLDGKMTKEELASMMYDSLNSKIKTLPDEVIVYPAHGPGSACGKNISKETWSTIGEQKKNNYALRPLSKTEFIKEVTEGLLPPPAYFFKDAAINKAGYESIDEVLNKNSKALSVSEFENAVNKGAQILDTRDPLDFEKGFIHGSINIGLRGMYAIWAGTLLDIQKPLLIVADEGREEESIVRLARVGYENVVGYLQGGFNAWKNAGKPLDVMPTLEPKEFGEKVKVGALQILDLRTAKETEEGHIKDSINVPLAELMQNFSSLPKNGPVYIHCAGGYRSMIAASILRTYGFDNIIAVNGGWNKIKLTGIPIEKVELV